MNAAATNGLQRVLFVDRDGTLIEEPPDEQVDTLEKIRFLPGVFAALQRLVAAGFRLVMVTNQDGLGTASFPEDTFWPVHNLVMTSLQNENIHFSEVHIDRTFPKDNAPIVKEKQIVTIFIVTDM